jgi:hypothetical protein
MMRPATETGSVLVSAPWLVEADSKMATASAVEQVR